MKETSNRQLKQKDIPEIRENILKEQGGRCKLCNCEITEETGYALDHQHMTLKEEIGVDGAGLVRGVLCRSCNSWEGILWNNTSRYLQPKTVQDRILILESLVQYYKKGTYNLVHPSEKPKETPISKRQYNKLSKLYKESGKRKKFPEYPKSKKLTKALEELFCEFNISPYLD